MMDFLVAFQTRNRPPAIRIRSRQEKPFSQYWNTGIVSLTMMRRSRAVPGAITERGSPTRRAVSR